jgi:hypothetical protein
MSGIGQQMRLTPLGDAAPSAQFIGRARGCTALLAR